SVALEYGDFDSAESFFKQGLKICHEIGYRRGEGNALIALSRLAYYFGDYNSVFTNGQQALNLSEGSGDRTEQTKALIYLGHGLLALGRQDEAAEYYRRALVLRQELQQRNLAIEPKAGLAAAALAEGDLAGAQREIEEIMAYAQVKGIDNSI